MQQLDSRLDRVIRSQTRVLPYCVVFPDVGLPPAGIRFIELGLFAWDLDNSSWFNWLAELPVEGCFADWTAWRR